MYYIGVDLGGTNIAVGIVDESFKIISKGSTPTCPNRDGELIIKDMALLTERLLKEASIPLSEVAYVGIASPGSVDPDKGTIEYANNLPFSQFPIAKCFQKYLAIPKVYVENDANAAALGEALAGVAKGTKNSVMITLGTGVGGGIIIDGKVYSGFNHAAGELGHTVIHFNGRPCSCGRKGCWEAYSSATALTALTKEKIAECKEKGIHTLLITEFNNTGKVSARTAFAAMKKGDKAAKEVVDYYIENLACGITNMISTFRPEILSIGGGICNEKDYLLQPLLKIVYGEALPCDGDNQTKIKIAALGNDAGIIGAACLGMQN
ncbi:MAG: ROK family protein [Clostridia bacterium]|nr:ROK family protein [Clostridia bacterium]